MKKEFMLRFDIANDATLGDANVADILRAVAERIAYVGITDNADHPVRDFNGNIIGCYGRYDTEED